MKGKRHFRQYLDAKRESVVTLFLSCGHNIDKIRKAALRASTAELILVVSLDPILESTGLFRLFKNSPRAILIYNAFTEEGLKISFED
jgi:hypothetical protein